jgi:ubiquinone/menaquinone biosynthesis C-methylase UbiE
LDPAVSVPPAPTLPPDYYTSIYEVEERHWWQRGMRAVSAALLVRSLDRPALRILDAGCGTGGFLRWLGARAPAAQLAGVDLSAEAVELARTRVPGAELAVSRVVELPFEDARFDVAVLNDVLQHIHEDELDRSVAELRRVLAPGGVLLVRTNGARRARRDLPDWRLHDRALLVSTLAPHLEVTRVTYANVLGSLAAAARGHGPVAPTGDSHGIPATGSPAADALKFRALWLEALALRARVRSLPYGHTLFALARRR